MGDTGSEGTEWEPTATGRTLPPVRGCQLHSTLLPIPHPATMGMAWGLGEPPTGETHFLPNGKWLG